MSGFGLFRRARVTRSLQVLTAVVLIAGSMTYPMLSASSSPTSAFEISDANIADGAASGPDWGALFTSGGAPNVVAGIDATTFTADLMDADALPSPPCFAGKKGDLTVFAGAGGEKNDDPFASWTYQSGSSPPSSNDLTNVYAASAKDGTDTVFYFGQERSNTNGDSHVDFEFTRQSVGLLQDVKNGDPAIDSAGCPMGHFTGARSVGDVLISVEYSNGGATGTAEVHVWDGDSYEQPINPGTNQPWTFAELTAAGTLGITTNAAPIACGAWNCRDSGGDTTSTLATHAFIEGFINVSDILPVVGCFSGFNAKTRSSDSWSSTLKDFALGSFNTCNANITLTPSGVNAVGSSHTFTAAVTNNDTGVYAPKAGVLVTGTTSFGTFVGGSTCTTDASGQCPLTITSSTAGSSTVNVSATVPLASGASVFRSTATAPGPGGSGPATKNWVDAYIKVTPDDVNPVGVQHTFTFEYGILGGAGTGLSVIPPSITPTITPAGFTTDANTCASPTKVPNQDVWQCTVTINSTATGVYAATATGSSTVNMANGTPGTVTLARSTTEAAHGTGGNNGATKTYVDARIAITPNGLNQVDDPTTPAIEDAHTVTATVESKIGNDAWTTVPAGVLVTFTLDQGTFVSGNTCQTNASGQCSIQINSTTAGTSTVSASTLVTTATSPAVTMARSSNSITKKWVDASIAIAATATNEVSHEHVFTITVTPIKPAGVSVTNVAVSPSVLPSTTNSTTCSNNVPFDGPTGLATCTFTVNSAAAGVFDVDATTVVGYSWNDGTTTFNQNVGRSTLAYAGPNGNNGATKTFVDARVSLGDDGLNRINDPHNVTGFAEYNDGTGWKPAQGKTITFAETSDTAASDFVSHVSTCVADSTGHCTVQIVSAIPGVTWVKATTSYSVGGVLLNRASAAGATDAANLRKEWVSAVISITPTAVNVVRDAHVFTILVTATAPAASIVIDAPTASVSPEPDSKTLVCAAQSGATRSCTLTINDNDAGIYTANAAATVTIGGLNGEVFNLTTNGQLGNSGPAVKTYVDASIALANDGVNKVGDPHLVIATVKQNAGQGLGFVSAGAGRIVTFVETGPGDIPVSCTTAATGTCSVTLTSTAPGVSTVHASVTVEVLGKSIVRETATAINTYAGGSGDLTKRWIDGAISITPNAVNPVGAAHVFTITATAIPSGAGTPGFVIAPSVVPAPTSYASTCGAPTVVGNTATCTVTINNSATGLFTANASVTITVAGVSLTRNTDPSDAIPAGSGGSGPATKRYVNADIQLLPDAINQVGEPHTVAAHVNVDNGAGNGSTPAPAGTVISFTKVSGPGTLSAPSCTTIDTTGSCTVVLNSTTVGTTILSASSSVTIDGVNLDLVTNGAGANSDTLEKDWVDGYVKVTPDGVNPVNQAHVFTVEYQVLAPAGTTVTLGSLTATVAPTPDGNPTACTPLRSGNTWTCTVTINSSVTGVFDIDAAGSATVTDSSIPGASKVVTRDTKGTSGSGGNAGATKTYVDARISVAPGGLNEVDDAHAVTATVETKNGDGAWTNAPANTTVTFDRQGAGSFSGPGTCLTITTTGACTISITSPVAGTTTVGAAATVTVNTVSITRTTGSSVNAAAGGSGPITKEWVDGSIKVETTATNEVNDDHVFTITAQAHLPSGSTDETAHFDSITPSVVDPLGALTTTSTCASPVVDGLTATCTFTINSATPGVFDVDAAVVMTIDNELWDPVTFTRSTSGDSGPSGNDGATKTFVDATVEVGLDGVNAVGDPHTVTGTAKKNAGTAWVAAAGETITFAITSGPGALSASSCVAGANGTCSVTLNSTTAGVTWVSASTSYKVGGVTLNRTTAVDGATDPDNLRKEWVKAHITITPTAVNTVNESHVFNVVVTGESSGAAITIGTVATTVTPVPDTTNLNCAGQVGASGTATKSCTLTINDSTAGVHTANASVTVTIGGVVFNLTTNGQGENSGPAVKTYVDARIKLANDGVNAVGDPHPVTATVEVNDGQGWDPAPAGVTVNLTETGPGSIPATCTTTANSAGSCTVSLTSTTAGISTVHASVTTNVLGEIITRETSTAINTAAGGSGDLTKRWVDGFVTITPDGVNAVGDPHTFTVSVTAIPSGAGLPTFNVVPSVSPAPTSMSTTCATPTVSGNTATCSVTINNNAQGVFGANVTATIAVGGVTLTRSTNSAVAPAGPGGSGPARKVYVDAAITVTRDGVNTVGDPHPVTGHVDVFGGSGKASAPAGTTIGFTIVSGPGSLSSTSCVTLGETGSCTVTLNSSATGVTVVSASTNVVIQGVTLTRTTDGQGANSGNLTKRWVDAFITIGETATNELNQPHVFTIKVTAIPSGASPVLFDSITTTLAPVPGTVSSTCDKPVVDANTATCTLTVNSAVAGVFVANATANLHIGGAAVTHSTDSTVATAGPGGSGPATKTYRAPVVLGEVITRPAVAAAPTLPRTGTDVLRLISVAMLLLVSGFGLVIGFRRRRSA